MKYKVILLKLALLASASASITITGFYGDLYNSSGALVPNNTLFVLVANPTGTFPGGFTLNSTLGSSGANSIFAQNDPLAVGNTLGTGTIFAIGGTSGSYADPTYSVSFGTNGVQANYNYAIYWFPGKTYDAVTPANNRVGTQVGGYNNTAGIPSLGFDGMTFPATDSGQSINQGFATVSTVFDPGPPVVTGDVPNSSLYAVTLIPEPTTALLAAFGSLALLRRRRH